MHINFKDFRSILALFCMILSYTNLIANENNDTPLQTIKLQLKWKHQFQFAGYYAAIEKGYYKEAGFNVILLEANEEEEPADAVMNHKANFGISTSDIVLTRGKGKPVVILASIFQHSPQVIIGSKKMGINHVHDLIGKRIMIEPHAADVISYLQDEGISLNQLEVLSHSFNVDQLINYKIDAITAYKTDEPYILQQSNFEYTVISPLSGGIDFYGDILFTSENMLRESPELVDKFLKASIKGWKYAMDNPEELVEIIFNKYSKRHSKEHLRFEAKKMQRYIMHNVVEIGYSNRGRWDNIIATYSELGLVDEDFNSEGMFYSDYLKPKMHIPWTVIGSVLSIFAFIGFIASFYFRLSRKLKNEITKRKEIQNNLIEANKEILSDIETRKITERELIRSKTILKEAQRIGNVGHWEYDIVKDKLHWSEQTYIIYEVSPEEFECTFDNVVQFFHQEDRQLVIDKYLSYSKEDTKSEITHRIITKSGKLKYLTQRSETTIDDNGIPVSTLGSVQDITKLKLAENSLFEQKTQLQELNATKDKLFSIIAHDLRSPFNSILGFSEILIENLKNLEVAESEKILGYINSSTKHTLILLDNLLNWANSQTGQIRFNPEKIIFSETILEIIKLETSIAKSKNISLHYSPSDEIEVYADKNMLKTVFRNLISNAIKFTKLGGHIRVSAISKQDHVEITISDDGIGMNKEKLKGLFNISSNTTTVGTANEKGSGLGLVICKDFIEKHDGKIWVESEEGKGSVFKFTLPLNKSTEK